MSQQIILDASVFVALIDRRDSYHKWAVSELAKISPPLLTCEAAITETCFLLQRIPSSKEIIFSFIDKGVVQIPFHLDDNPAKHGWQILTGTQNCDGFYYARLRKL